jgi:hypothetical protein
LLAFLISLMRATRPIHLVLLIFIIYLCNKKVLVAWLVGWLVGDYLLFRDFEPYVIVFMTMSVLDFPVIRDGQFTSPNNI